MLPAVSLARTERGPSDEVCGFHAARKLTKSVRALLVGLLAASAFVVSSTISGEATASTPHVGSTCVQAAAFPYGSAVVGIAETHSGDGYWIVTNDGYVAACGDAPVPGSANHSECPDRRLAATPDGGGYYLVASDGGVFAFGDAAFQGSPGAIHLNSPVVGMAVDPTTGGYWLVATDGGIFAYDAPFLGSTGSMALNRPVTGMAAASDGTGYWLVASDGGVFAFGVPFLGSTGSIPLNRPVVGMAADAESRGYWLVASDGGIFSYRAPFYGSTGSIVLNRPIAGMEAAARVAADTASSAPTVECSPTGRRASTGRPCSPRRRRAQVTAVGDSIMVDYQDPLKIDIPGVTVDAAGRPPVDHRRIHSAGNEGRGTARARGDRRARHQRADHRRRLRHHDVDTRWRVTSGLRQCARRPSMAGPQQRSPRQGCRPLPQSR